MYQQDQKFKDAIKIKVESNIVNLKVQIKCYLFNENKTKSVLM